MSRLKLSETGGAATDGTPAFQPGPLGIKYGPDGKPFSVSRDQWGAQQWTSPYTPANAALKLNPTGQVMATPKGKGAAALPAQDVTSQGVTGADVPYDPTGSVPPAIKVDPDAPINQPQIDSALNADEQKLVTKAAKDQVTQTLGRDAYNSQLAFQDAQNDHGEAQAALDAAKAAAKDPSADPVKAQSDIQAAQQVATQKQEAYLAAGREKAAKVNAHQQALTDPLGYLQRQQDGTDQSPVPPTAQTPATSPTNTPGSPSNPPVSPSTAPAAAQPPISGAAKPSDNGAGSLSPAPQPSVAPPAAGAAPVTSPPPNPNAPSLSQAPPQSVIDALSTTKKPEQVLGPDGKTPIATVGAGQVLGPDGKPLPGVFVGGPGLQINQQRPTIQQDNAALQAAAAAQPKEAPAKNVGDLVNNVTSSTKQGLLEGMVVPSVQAQAMAMDIAHGRFRDPNAPAGDPFHDPDAMLKLVNSVDAQWGSQQKDAGRLGNILTRSLPKGAASTVGTMALTGGDPAALGVMFGLQGGASAYTDAKAGGANYHQALINAGYGAALNMGLGLAMSGASNTALKTALGDNTTAFLAGRYKPTVGEMSRYVGLDAGAQWLLGASSKVGSNAMVQSTYNPHQAVMDGVVDAGNQQALFSTMHLGSVASAIMERRQPIIRDAVNLGAAVDDLHSLQVAGGQTLDEINAYRNDQRTRTLQAIDANKTLTDAQKLAMKGNALTTWSPMGQEEFESLRPGPDGTLQASPDKIKAAADRVNDMQSRFQKTVGDAVAKAPKPTDQDISDAQASVPQSTFDKQAALDRYNAQRPQGMPPATEDTLQSASDLAPQVHANTDLQPAAEHYLPVAHQIEQLSDPIQRQVAAAAVKVANGRALTADDRTLLFGADDGSQLAAVTPTGQPFVRMEGDRPILTDDGLARVKQLAPATGDVLPRSEQSQLEAQPATTPATTKGKSTAAKSTQPTEAANPAVETNPVKPAVVPAPDPAFAKTSDETLGVQRDNLEATKAAAQQRGAKLHPDGEAHLARIKTEIARRARASAPASDVFGAPGGAKEGDEIDYAHPDNKGNQVQARGEVDEVHPDHYVVIDPATARKWTVPIQASQATSEPAKTADSLGLGSHKILDKDGNHIGNVHVYNNADGQKTTTFAEPDSVVRPGTKAKITKALADGGSIESDTSGYEPAGAKKPNATTQTPSEKQPPNLPGMNHVKIQAPHLEAAQLLSDAYAKNKTLFAALGFNSDIFQPQKWPKGTIGLGVTDGKKLLLDLPRLADNLARLDSPGQRKLRVDAVVEEEAIHAAVKKLLGGKADAMMTDIWRSLTPAQQRKVMEEYGSYLDDSDDSKMTQAQKDERDAQRGHEYMRMVVQLERSGRTTEWSNKLSGAVTDYLRAALKALKNLLTPNDPAVKSLTQRIQNILDKGSDDDGLDMSPPGDQPPVNGNGRHPADIAMSNGDTLPARYELAELGSLSPSHRNGTPNPDYPHGLNERDYSLPEEKQKNEAMANGFDPRRVVTDNPDAVNGPPIVDKQGLVLGGNRRTILLSDPRAYAKYRPYLQANADRFGLKADDVAKMQQPVLVRRVDTSNAHRPELVRRLNEVPTGGIDTANDAVSAGKQITPDLVNTVSNLFQQDPDKTPLQHLSDGDTKAIAQGLLDAGAIRPNDKEKYVGANGNLTPEGARFARSVLLGGVLPDAQLLREISDTPTETKLLNGLSPLYTMKARGADISPLREAVTLEADRQRRDVKNVNEHQAQGNLAGIGQEATTEGKTLQSFLAGIKGNEARRAFTQLQNLVSPLEPGQAGLFGEKNRSSIAEVTDAEMNQVIKSSKRITKAADGLKQAIEPVQAAAKPTMKDLLEKRVAGWTPDPALAGKEDGVLKKEADGLKAKIGKAGDKAKVDDQRRLGHLQDELYYRDQSRRLDGLKKVLGGAEIPDDSSSENIPVDADNLLEKLKQLRDNQAHDHPGIQGNAAGQAGGGGKPGNQAGTGSGQAHDGGTKAGGALSKRGPLRPEEALDALKQNGLTPVARGANGSISRAARDQHDLDLISAAGRSGMMVGREKVAALRIGPDVGGGEHEAYQTPDGSRMTKITLPGKFGLNVDAPDYLTRFHNAQTSFPDLDYNVEGVTVERVKTHGGKTEVLPQIITSMKYISGGVHPDNIEVRDWFKRYGWEPVNPDPDGTSTIWRDPKTGAQMIDTHGGNWLKQPLKPKLDANGQHVVENGQLQYHPQELAPIDSYMELGPSGEHPSFAKATTTFGAGIRDTQTPSLFDRDSTSSRNEAEIPRNDDVPASKQGALKAYKTLTAWKSEGKKLSVGQEQMLENAERALGQQFIPGLPDARPYHDHPTAVLQGRINGDYARYGEDYTPDQKQAMRAELEQRGIEAPAAKPADPLNLKTTRTGSAVHQSLFDTGQDVQRGQSLLFGDAVADHPDVEQPLTDYVTALRQGELNLEKPINFSKEFQTDLGRPAPVQLVDRAQELETHTGEPPQTV